MFIYCSESFFPPFLTHLYPCIAMPKFRLALMMQLHPCDHVTADLIVAIIKPEVFSAYCTLASGDVGPDGCRNRSVGFVLPVFSALGVSVRLAAFPLLSPYTTGLRQRVKCHPLGILRLLLSLLSLMIAARVCMRERNRARDRESRSRLRDHALCVRLRFSERVRGVWG